MEIGDFRKVYAGSGQGFVFSITGIQFSNRPLGGHLGIMLFRIKPWTRPKLLQARLGLTHYKNEVFVSRFLTQSLIGVPIYSPELYDFSPITAYSLANVVYWL